MADAAKLVDFAFTMVVKVGRVCGVIVLDIGHVVH